MSNQGGKRAGAGRPKGSQSVSAELRAMAREHTKAAIDALVDVVKNPEHADRLKAADMLLSRGYGKPTEENPAGDIITRFMGEEISAVQAVLELEANGLTVSPIMKRYFDNELKVVEESKNKNMTGIERAFLPAEPLPRI